MAKRTLNHSFAEKLQNWMTANDNAVRWSLTDAFWIMHLDFSVFLKFIKNPKNSKLFSDINQVKSCIDNLKSTIIKYFSKAFENDSKQFITKRINYISDDISDRDTAIAKENCCIQQVAQQLTAQNIPPDDLYLAICSVIEGVYNLSQSIASFAKDFPYHIPEKHLQQPSDIPKIIQYIDEEKGEVPGLKRDSSDFRIFHTRLERLMEQLATLQSQLHGIAFQKEDAAYRDCIAFCEEHLSDFPEWKKYIIDMTTKLEYAIDGSFNNELILIFLFSNYDTSVAGKSLQCVIRKHETFFLYLYDSLRKVSPATEDLLHASMDYCPREITDPYYHQIPSFHSSTDKRPLLFSLKKLISLYQFYSCASQKPMPQCIKSTLNVYRMVLTETRFVMPVCLPMLDDLPTYILNTFGLGQTDLARILNVGDYTISRKKSTLIQDYLWFWTAATDFTYTYMWGETTIPDYGKIDPDSPIYGIGVMGQMAYAELFLRYIEDLGNYRQKLLEDGQKTRFVLNKDYIQHISDNTIRIMETIQKSREVLDHLYGWHISKKSALDAIESEIKELESQGTARNRKTNTANLQNRKDSLIQDYMQSKNIFDKAAKNFENFLDYKGKLLMVWNQDRLEKLLEDLESTSKALEKAKNDRNNYEDIDEANRNIEKAQTDYAKRLHEMDAYLDAQKTRWKQIKDYLSQIPK